MSPSPEVRGVQIQIKNRSWLSQSKSDTEKKILRNVVRSGDMYFRSGDIMCMDEFGWIYFMDRAGDTFRSGVHLDMDILIALKTRFVRFISNLFFILLNNENSENIVNGKMIKP